MVEYNLSTNLSIMTNKMNTTLKDRLLQLKQFIQRNLFTWQEEELLELTPKLEEVIHIIEFTEIDRFVPGYRGRVGRHGICRVEIARAFVAKAVLNLPTTEALIDRLHNDMSLRRICGFERYKDIPPSWTFSRAYAEFAEMGLPERVHEALIKRELGDQLVGHVKYDSTAIEGREKPVRKESKPEEKSNEEKPKAKPGRPRKGEERPAKEPTVLEKQQNQTLEQMLEEMPKDCDVGCKKNSQGYKETWIGYKFHIATGDGDIPLAAVLSSASMHDSGAMLPLMRITQERVTWCYDLADSAYCSEILREESRKAGHVPLIDHNPRRGEKKEFAPHEAQRYKERSGAERVNSHLKDNRGGRMVRVRAHDKVFAHLMFGILSIAAGQLLRLST